MPTPSAKLRQISAFARAAGVTVRALRLYDRLGLLKPAAMTASGYRLYGDRELGRLEHILALRFVGFNLQQIKELLHGSSPPLAVALQMQRDVIARRKRHLESALAAIDQAQSALAGHSTDRWQTLVTVIEVFRMQNDWDWTKSYYSDEGLQTLEQHRSAMPNALVEQGQRDWSALIVEVEEAASRGTDPSGKKAQLLAERWRSLIRQFTQDDPEVRRGVNRLWSDSTHWPKDFQRPWSDGADAFIKKALEPA